MILDSLISHIARCSFVDGPGIRTTVFMKGCPLDCAWCHNPESIGFQKEQHRNEEQCLLCLSCIKACEHGAIKYDGSFHFEPDNCINCQSCEQSCDSKTLSVIGYHLDPNDLLEILLRDRVYYEISSGGVTFSGGEPLIHIDYLSSVIQGLKKEGIHVAVQTSGYFKYDHFKRSLQKNIDLIYYDLKIMDRSNHKVYTGKDNDLILKNLKKLSDSQLNQLIVRTPLIPGITDKPRNLRDIKEFVRELSVYSHEFLPFNPAGKAVNMERK